MTDVGTLATLPDPTLVEERSSISFRFSRRTWLVIGAVTLATGVLAMTATFFLPQQFVVSRSLLIMSGNNPNDNDTLVRAFEEIMADKGFAAEIKARTGLKLPAETIKAKVESLNAASISQTSWDAETAAWVGKLDSMLYDKLAKVGPVRATPE